MGAALREKVMEFIARHRMIAAGDCIIAALSGGADSMALFQFLLELREEAHFTLAAAHFEHGLRGEESLRDAQYVKEVCEMAGVPFHMEYGNMAARTPPKGQGTEEWGRLLRYSFFDGLAARYNAKIATAHTRTDNAETVLFNAIRGSGPRGLSGIPPVRRPYIRPFLEVSRTEVEQFCGARRLRYIHDRYNDDVYFSRNRLRTQVMPLLEQAHPGAGRNLSRMAADMGELDIWLTAEAEKLLGSAAATAKAVTVPQIFLGAVSCYDVNPLLSAPPPLRLKALAILAGRAADRQALLRMERLVCGALGAVQLPGGRLARLYRGLLLLEANQKKKEDEGPSLCTEPFKTGDITLPGGISLHIKTQNAEDMLCKEPKNGKIGIGGLPFYADYDRIPECCVFRFRRPHDRFAPAARKVTKPLRKWMNEAGIPPVMRDMLPLLCDKERVIWVLGGGFCEDVQPDGATRNMVNITAELIKQEDCYGADDR